MGIDDLESCVWVGMLKRDSLMGGHGWGQIDRLPQLGGIYGGGGGTKCNVGLCSLRFHGDSQLRSLCKVYGGCFWVTYS